LNFGFWLHKWVGEDYLIRTYHRIYLTSMQKKNNQKSLRSWNVSRW